LLERLEEHLKLSVLAADGGGSEGAMIGQKHQVALLLFVPDFDVPQEQISPAFPGQLIEEDDLFPLEVAAHGDRATLQNSAISVFLHARKPRWSVWGSPRLLSKLGRRKKLIWPSVG
jgi:hypothetical protein